MSMYDACSIGMQYPHAELARIGIGGGHGRERGGGK